ncbi:hypothetical protein QMZ92_35105 [Streptomyces sp. HNM0645]|uniref:hypothetical protein n=1 Tax=Streptomyces sp. HNM0645 TaxID=2782343 RepID=UPI0024B86EC7|nr:hypothetical protein [Streptomyces sp. HNM0645]MDI9889401.1 hypothetical protein [Streptomyces sp. HNM0645]
MTTINHDSGHDQPTQPLTEDRRLELSRASEERHRPVTVRVYVSPITSRAALRWVNAEGHDSPTLWEPVPLDGNHAHALRDEVLNLAGAVLAKRGFNYARGAYWKPASGDQDPDACWSARHPGLREPACRSRIYLFIRYLSGSGVHCEAEQVSRSRSCRRRTKLMSVYGIKAQAIAAAKGRMRRSNHP